MANEVAAQGKVICDSHPDSEKICFRREGGRLIYQYDAEKLWIEPWGKNSLRVRATHMAEMPWEDWALTEPAGSYDPEIQIHEDGSAEIRHGKLVARFTAGGKLSFWNQNGQLLLNEYVRNRRDITSDFCSALEIDAREFRPLIGGDYQVSMRFESLSVKEHLFGMGQYQHLYVDLKGTDLELAHRNSQASVPFVLSSLGYGFLWNNPAIGRVVFGKNITTWEAKSTEALDYWVTAGDTPAEIEEAYAAVTGKVPMMPDYAMGFWQCKLRYQTQEELLEVARRISQTRFADFRDCGGFLPLADAGRVEI